MKTLFYLKGNSFWESQTERLKESFPDDVFVFTTDQDSAEIPDADIIVGGGVVPSALIERAQKLKLFIVPFVGVNHLPLDMLRKKGVLVANSHGNNNSVAERALAMILAFYGKIITYHEDLKRGKWHGFWVGQGLEDTWESIMGKSCSIIGAGEIGKSLAGMLKSFNCSVTGFKKHRVNEVPPGYNEMVYDFFKAVEKSEIIVNILPLTRETENIFSEEVLQRMRGKVFVNVGRGGTVDEKALFEALRNGVLKGAAIDTWYTYPENGKTTGYPSRYPFHELSNVVLSPHTAGFTRQASAENIRQAFNNLESYLKSGSVINRVDVNSGY